jgi:hypothetical protein
MRVWQQIGAVGRRGCDGAVLTVWHTVHSDYEAEGE